MKEYRKTTPQGELIYKLSDTASGKMKLETVYPNGYVYETPYELDEFHLMTWGYVEVSNLGLRFNADETGELWSCLQGSVPLVVFPATADQIEFVEGGKTVFILRGRRYSLLREYGRSVMSDNYDPTRDMIRRRLLGGIKGISLSGEDLRLFDDDFSYEFEAFQARTRSDRPIEALLDQFSRLGAHTNSWHYLIGIEVPKGYVLPAAQVRYLRHYFETLETRTLSLKVSVRENPSLQEGTVAALMVTHYNERCFPATFEFRWIDAFNQCTLEEILKADRSLRYQIRNPILCQQISRFLHTLVADPNTEHTHSGSQDNDQNKV